MLSTQALIIVLARAGIFEIRAEDNDEIIFFDAKDNVYHYDKVGDAVSVLSATGERLSITSLTNIAAITPNS